MATVYLSPVYPPTNDPRIQKSTNEQFSRFLKLSQLSRRHSTTENSDYADIILLYASFTLFFSNIDRNRISLRQNPLRKFNLEKTFVYDIDDMPVPFLPGVYASVDRRYFDPARQRPGPYIHQLGNARLEPWQKISQAPHLFSFVGAPSTHPSRLAIFQLQHCRGHIVPTSAKWPKGAEAKESFKASYAAAIHNSKFVICPRGRGTGSTRTFEVLQAGRVPVIIADDWVPPIGPESHKFSVRVPEREIQTIPNRLEEMESDAERMGSLARTTFEDWFSEDAAFDRIMDWCLDLKRQRTISERWGRFRVIKSYRQLKVLRRWIAGQVRG